MQQQLQAELGHLSREFNNQIHDAVRGLLPSTPEAEALGARQAFSTRYLEWKATHERLFSRIAIATPHAGALDLMDLDLESGTFASANWPPEWRSIREALASKSDRSAPGEVPAALSSVIVIPGFSNLRPPERRPADRDWLVLELNLTYLRGSLLPELVNRYLGAGGKLDYVAEVVDADDPSQIIFQSGPGVDRLIHESADASVLLLNVPEIHGPPGGPPGRMYRMRFRGGRGPGYPHPPAFEPGAPPMPPPAVMGQGRWRLIVRHQAGSLESVVSRARWQNLATSLGILTLILITVATLVRLSRRAQRLAELQMNFVAGISHELRTPLAVIRTAAFNLRGKIAVAPEQVERYGALIQTESEKLGALVEQVLRFARARAGHPIGAREPVEIERVIDEGLQSIAASIPVSNVTVEKKIERDLPLVLADPVALKQAVQNLVENAMKYGLNGSNWIGISATRIAGANGASVEVRVADRGPGIPPDEQEHIFEPFFRGRRAVRDQIHGTGLGLNLAKNIVEAHGGALRVESDANKGAEFVLRIPAAPEEVQNEFAHTAG